ncbi:MAG: hypothetical protein V4773_00305 [Verrucomicrobiota bacterium]
MKLPAARSSAPSTSNPAPRRGGHALRLFLLAVFSASFALAAPAPAPAPIASTGQAEAKPFSVPLNTQVQLGIDAYEAIQFGYTQDESNEAFVDILASLRVPLLPAQQPVHGHGWQLFGDPAWAWHPFWAATYRGGQHLLTRESSPVVSKRFNPVLLAARFVRNPEEKTRHEFIDVLYAHESNGQSIANRRDFEDLRAIHARSESPETAENIARDAISRGWDYFSGRYDYHTESSSFSTVLKVFMVESLPQGEKEEYNRDWENDPQGKSRQSVDGLTVSYLRRFKSHYELGATWTTGLEHAFKYHTVKIEAGYRFSGRTRPRAFLWVRQGYNSDLVNYYRRSVSVGFAISIWEPSYLSNLLPPSAR